MRTCAEWVTGRQAAGQAGVQLYIFDGKMILPVTSFRLTLSCQEI